MGRACAKPGASNANANTKHILCVEQLCTKTTTLAATIVLHLHTSLELLLDVGLGLGRVGCALGVVRGGDTGASLLTTQKS